MRLTHNAHVEGTDDGGRYSSGNIFNRLAFLETIASAKKKEHKNRGSNAKEVKRVPSQTYTTSSFFDKLAYKETISSSMKKERQHNEGKESEKNGMYKSPPIREACYDQASSFFDKLAYRETFSSSMKKERPLNEGKEGKKTTIRQSPRPLLGKVYCGQNKWNNNIRRNPATTTNLFFDRLALTETISSARRKDSSCNDYADTCQIDLFADKSKVNFKGNQTSVTKHSPIFERLSSTETYSSANRKGRCNNDDEVINYYIIPQTVPSIFNRLASTETVASRCLKDRTKSDDVFEKDVNITIKERKVGDEKEHKMDKTVPKMKPVLIRTRGDESSSSSTLVTSISKKTHISNFERLAEKRTTRSIQKHRKSVAFDRSTRGFTPTIEEVVNAESVNEGAVQEAPISHVPLKTLKTSNMQGSTDTILSMHLKDWKHTQHKHESAETEVENTAPTVPI